MTPYHRHDRRSKRKSTRIGLTISGFLKLAMYPEGKRGQATLGVGTG